jgi:uncharacterized protein YdbL (DUF1318 family)
MDDEELFAFVDVLEEASAARYQMLPKKSQLTTDNVERIGNIYE